MQPASQDPFEIYDVYLLILGIAFLIIGILYIFSREASRREHLKKWSIIVIKLSCPFLRPLGDATPQKRARGDRSRSTPS
jgi:hypothetical protein